MVERLFSAAKRRGTRVLKESTDDNTPTVATSDPIDDTVENSNERTDISSMRSKLSICDIPNVNVEDLLKELDMNVLKADDVTTTSTGRTSILRGETIDNPEGRDVVEEAQQSKSKEHKTGDALTTTPIKQMLPSIQMSQHPKDQLTASSPTGVDEISVLTDGYDDGDKAFDKDTNKILFCTSEEEVNELSLIEPDLTATNIKLFLDDFSRARMGGLIRGITSNMFVKRLELFLVRKSHNTVQICQELELLFRALHILPHLHTLVVQNLLPSDLEYLPSALRGQDSLKTLKLHFHEGTLDEEMLRVLSTMKNVEGLELDVGESFAVGSLLHSKTCRVLKVVGHRFTFEQCHVLSMLQPLESNRALQMLDIGPTISGMPMKVLAQALRRNRTLEELHVSFTATQKMADTVVETLANSLAVNTTLRVFWNHSYARVSTSKESRDAILETLKMNRHMRRFHAFNEDPDFWSEKTAVMERHKSKTLVSWLMPLLCMSSP